MIIVMITRSVTVRIEQDIGRMFAINAMFGGGHFDDNAYLHSL